MASQRTGTLATTGPYAHLRHPQYTGFVLIMVGFLLRWPTIPTLAMFRVLVLAYRRLAAAEDRAMEREFGDRWSRYASRTPAFLPRLRHAGPAQVGGRSPAPPRG